MLNWQGQPMRMKKLSPERLVAVLMSSVFIPLLAMLCFLGSANTVGAKADSKDSAANAFKMRCAPCHADDGSGNTSPGKALGIPDLRSHEIQGQTDAQLASVITNGTKKMPAFKDKLTEAEIHALVKHVRTFAHKS